MDYLSAKRSLVVVKKDMIHHPFKTTLVLLFFILAIIGSVVLTTYVSGYVTKFLNTTPTLENPKLPPKTLFYEIINRSPKDGDGLYHTLFSVSVHNPAGNTNPTATVLLNIDQRAECVQGSLEEIVEAGAGLASTTQTMLVECITREKVIDSGDLFSVIKE